MRSRSLKSLEFKSTNSWTDDLPVCKQSGVGSSTNQVYREDGRKDEDHPFEDRSFHCNVDDSIYFYGVFDGHGGTNTVTFTLQRMAAEVLLGQLNGKSTDEEIKEVLRQAFTAVEKGYLHSIDDLLAERTSILMQIPDGMNSYEAYQKFPQIMERLDEINCELSSGTTAVIVLVYHKKLYVANVGNSRALLCKTDANSVLRVVQLSVDHDLKNEDELLRLSQLSVDVEAIKDRTLIGNQENTRCLGNYMIKSNYTDYEEFGCAVGEPVIAEPEILGGIELDDSCRFLLLMSDGLYHSLEQATTTTQVNKDIVQLVVEQFRVQSTLAGVAQAVVDKIVRIHHDFSLSNNSQSVTKRDDIILLIRNFNFPLPHAAKTPTTVRFHPIVKTHSNDAVMTDVASNSENDYSTNYSSTNTIKSNSSDTTTTSSSAKAYVHSNSSGSLVYDSEKRIAAYVDFSDYYKNIESARRNGTLPDGFEF